jgi:GNAT superfamily N-acetyltransferase
MEIRTYTTGTILDFVSSEQFSRLRHLPVSKLRALSYAHNPRSESSDKILFVAYENDEVAGYIGALPEKIFYNGEWRRMTWLSCFWIDPEFRGKGLSKQLFDMAMHAWEDTAMITNMQPGTLQIYEKMGYFYDPYIITGIRGYLRFNLAEILPLRGGIFRRIKPLLRMVDFVGNIGNGIRLLFYPGYKVDPHIHYEYVEEISREAEELINSCNQSYLNRRGKAELEWICRYPWVAEQDEDAGSLRYYFSSVAKRFFYQMVEFSNEAGEVTGFLMLSVRNNHLTLPYVFYQPGLEPAIVKFLFNKMLDYQLNMLTVFHPQLSGLIRRSRTPFLFKKNILRPYFLPRTLDLPAPAFQDGDGDGAFT